MQHGRKQLLGRGHSLCLDERELRERVSELTELLHAGAARALEMGEALRAAEARADALGAAQGRASGAA